MKRYIYSIIILVVSFSEVFCQNLPCTDFTSDNFYYRTNANDETQDLRSSKDLVFAEALNEMYSLIKSDYSLKDSDREYIISIIKDKVKVICSKTFYKNHKYRTFITIEINKSILKENLVSLINKTQDNTPPSISIIYPKVSRGFKLIEQNEQLNIIGKTTDENGIFRVTINDSDLSINSDGTFETSVLLAYGENIITIKSTDLNQNTSEYTFFINREFNQAEIRNKINPSERKKIALVIGNSNYINIPLKNPVNDANLISKELIKLGFEVTTLINCTQNQMKQAISNYGTILSKDKNNVGLFYYAGHGMQVKGKNYLIPIDAKIEKEPDVEVFCVNTDGLIANLEYAGNSLNIIILDACRNNPFGRSFRSQAGNGLAVLNAPVGTIVAFSTSPGSTASDGEGNNGLYTQELVKTLQIPNLKIEDVFKKVRTQVKILSNGQQIPWENSALEGDFYFKN